MEGLGGEQSPSEHLASAARALVRAERKAGSGACRRHFCACTSCRACHRFEAVYFSPDPRLAAAKHGLAAAKCFAPARRGSGEQQLQRIDPHIPLPAANLPGL